MHGKKTEEIEPNERYPENIPKKKPVTEGKAGGNKENDSAGVPAEPVMYRSDSEEHTTEAQVNLISPCLSVGTNS